jgi:hypothetical protein
VSEISHDKYMLICALLTGIVAGYWVLVDSVRLRRALKEDRREPVVRDRIFGSLFGIAIGLIGVFGTLNFYYW